MKRVLTILLAGILIAAGPETRLDTTTTEAYSASYEKMILPLDEEQKAQLDRALLDLVLIISGTYRPLAEAKSLAQGKNSVFDITRPLIESMIDTAWKSPETRAKAVIKNIAAIVENMSAPEIREVAERMRLAAHQDAIAALQERLISNDSDLEAAERDQRGAEMEARAKRILLDQVSITNSRFYYDKPDIISVTKPIIAFDITNGTKLAIKTISLQARVQTPGRAIAWHEAGILYEFKGGLEPGEHQDLKLAANMFSDWGKIPKEVVSGAVTTLTLVGIEDANGTKINEAVDAAAIKKRDQLLKIKTTLEEKINELRQEAAALRS